MSIIKSQCPISVSRIFQIWCAHYSLLPTLSVPSTVLHSSERQRDSMETRAAAKRRAMAANLAENQPAKRKRVVLGELTNLTNANVPATSNHQSNKPAATKKTGFVRIKLEREIFNDENDPKCAPHSNEEFNDPRATDPFVSDIYMYLRSMEMERRRRPRADYLEEVQRNVTANMRGILVDWLVEVAEEYKLLSDTLYLSISYIDRYLSLNRVTKPFLQLLGVSSMLIASKYEEIDPKHVEEFCLITDNTYDKREVVEMEAKVLKSLNFELGSPTVKTFLRRFSEIASENQKFDIQAQKLQFEFLGCYLAELSLLEYDCLKFLPSLVAASAVFLARYIIWPKLQPWTLTLRQCTGYIPMELKECVNILHDLYLGRRGACFNAIREKYKQHKFKYVANLPVCPQIPKCCFEDE